MKGREQVFTHPSQLNMLSALPFLRTGGMGRLRLGGSLESHPNRQQWEGELNRHYHACGCQASAAALLVALMLAVLWAGYRVINAQMELGSAAWTVLVVAVAGAVLGKLAGRIDANNKLKKTAKDIQAQWQVDEKPVRQGWTCG